MGVSTGHSRRDVGREDVRLHLLVVLERRRVVRLVGQPAVRVFVLRLDRTFGR